MPAINEMNPSAPSLKGGHISGTPGNVNSERSPTDGANPRGSGTSVVGRTLLDDIAQWEREWHPWREDCAKVSKYYSGGVIETKKEQALMGLVEHHNFQSGRAQLRTAKDESYNAFLQPQRLVSFKLRDYEGTPSEKASQEQRYSRMVDTFLRKTHTPFMHETRKMCDRHVVHGDAVMVYPPEGEGWQPIQATILTDLDAPVDVVNDGFWRWAVSTDIQLGEALDAIAEEREGWTIHAEKFLKSEWEVAFNSVEKGVQSDWVHAMRLYDDLNPEEWETAGQTGINLSSFVTRRLRVYNYYQKDFGEPGSQPTVDMYIVARFMPEDNLSSDPLIYKRKGAYDNVEQALKPFVLDTSLGIETPTWGTIKGLGHLNFIPDRLMNLLISALHNSAVDKSTPLYQVASGADMKLLEKWIKQGYRANGVLPADLQLVDKNVQGMQIGEALNLIGFYQQMSSENAVPYTGQSNPARDELRVQTLQRSEQDTRRSGGRSADFAVLVDGSVTETGRRIAGAIYDNSGDIFIPQNSDDKVNDLRNKLLSEGVEMEWFFPENLEIGYSRLAGDGDPVRRIQIAENLLSRIAFIPDEERPNVLMEWYAATTGDWARAEQIFGQGDQGSTDARVTALMKASTVMELGTPLPVTAEDLPEITLPAVVKTMEANVIRAEEEGMVEKGKLDGFIALGQWGIMLVQKLEGIGSKEVARVFEGQIQDLSRRMEGPRKATEQKEQAMDSEQQDMQIKMEKLALDDRKVSTGEALAESKIIDTANRQNAALRRTESSEFDNTRKLQQTDERIKIDRLEAQIKILQVQISAEDNGEKQSDD